MTMINLCWRISVDIRFLVCFLEYKYEQLNSMMFQGRIWFLHMSEYFEIMKQKSELQLREK